MYFVFRVFGFDQLHRNEQDLQDFLNITMLQKCGVMPRSEEKWLVVLRYTGELHKWSSFHDCDKIEPEMQHFTTDEDVFYAWCVFYDESSANDFHAKLSGVRYLASYIPKSSRTNGKRDRFTLSQLSREESYLSHFKRTCDLFDRQVEPEECYIVLLTMDYGIVQWSAGDPGAQTAASSISENREHYYGWKIFSCEEDADKFANELESLDKLSPLATKLFQTPPPAARNEEQIRQFQHQESRTFSQRNAAENPPSESVKRSLYQSFAGASPSVGTPNGCSKVAAGISEPSLPPKIDRLAGSEFSLTRSGGSSSVVNGSCQYHDMSSMEFKFDPNPKWKERGVGVQFFCSAAFPNKSQTLNHAILFMVVPPDLYWADSEFFKQIFDQYVDKVLKRRGEEPPLYMTSLQDVGRCDPKKRSVCLRNSSGYLKTIIIMKIQMPKHLSTLDSHVCKVVNTLGSRFTKCSTIGEEFVDWTKTRRNGVYNFERGLSGRRPEIDHDAFVKKCQDRLVKMFQHKTVEYNVPLDRYLTHGYIKEFFAQYGGYNDWSDLPVTFKKSILTNRNQDLPDWGSVEVEHTLRSN